MGNDGGSIPTRRELVKEAARQPSATQLKETQHEQQAYHWTTCPLSKRPLQRPVVSDANGKLYNKDAVIEYLLPASDDDPSDDKAEADKVLLGSVKSLKDIVEVKFEVDADATATAKHEGRVFGEIWKCPVTGKLLGPGVKAVYVVPCGHAFEAAAIREVADGKCAQCDEAYAPNDVIPILPVTEEDIARLALRVKTLKEKGLTHSLKKASGGKKRKKNAEAEANGEASGDKEKKEKKKKAKAENGEPSRIKNAATASLTQKVRDELEAKNKQRKTQKNDNLSGLFSSKDPSRKNNDFMNRGFTIPAYEKK